jgi:hypothetical protein
MEQEGHAIEDKLDAVIYVVASTVQNRRRSNL